jgi:adenylosuccinate synthase
MTSEQNNQLGDDLALKGKEFGTVTGRKRRCGWFDTVITRQAAQITGINSIALTKLDVLDGLETIKICVKYRHNGKFYDYLPAVANMQSCMEPIYEEMPGWQGESVYKINNIEKLPKNALNYVKKIEELVGKPISLISTGPERQDIIKVDSKSTKI